MHKTTGRWRLGLTLTLITVFLWASLPIPLRILLDVMDPYTITWVRLLVAALLLGLWLLGRSRLPALHRLPRRDLALLVVAALGLAGNYVFYLLGLHRVAASAAQVLIQLAPMFLLLGGLFIFHERFSAVQWAGFFTLTGGLVLYFHDHLGALVGRGDYAIGVALIVTAGVLWAAYAMAQKQLLLVLRSEAIMWTIYAAAVVLFLPAISPTELRNLSALQVALLAYTCLNTLVAYG